ncbi:MAG TPA: TRAP transporter small permease [Ferrovibrio sp.]|uniref:TRAP transporter small permease subunit n=1 Tax=Ferrovibrio sp. TaxID=1917215 RepID=UPI002ED3AAF6
MIRALGRGIGRIEAVAGVIAAAVMFLIMMIATADVGMRYIFNSPFSWAYDLIGLYLMTALFYLVLSATFAHHAHVSVDILQHYMSLKQRRICEVVICACAFFLFAAIAYAGADRAWTSFTDGDVLAGQIPWPTWPSIALVPLGAGLLALRLVLHVIGHIYTLITGVEIFALAPISSADEALEQGMVE